MKNWIGETEILGHEKEIWENTVKSEDLTSELEISIIQKVVQP